MEFIIVLIMLGFLYLIFKPKTKPKSKEQKQAEIMQKYKNILDTQLSGIENKNLMREKKTALLKTFASELNRNLFFDEHEVRALIQKLVNYEIK